MRASEDSSESTPRPPDNSTVILLLATIADTTWRMFVPTIGFILLGWWGDNTFGTKPWLTIAGIMIGTLITSQLIRRQLREVKRNN